ncbi:MAG: hypothetical protein JWL83_2749 [Actinomycetia bacterium]|nr:hypothetical protein [Actinomycetes bacterium]
MSVDAQINDATGLRPVERRMLRLAADGLDATEIGARFKRSPEHVERVLEFARLPGRHEAVGGTGLRPVERRLLRWRAKGVSLVEIARHFRRSPGHIERVLALVDHKRSRGVAAGG